MSDERCKCFDEPGTLDCPVCSKIEAPSSLVAPTGSEALARVRVNLQRRAEYYRTKTDDPYGMNTALYVAMLEVSNSIGEALK